MTTKQVPTRPLGKNGPLVPRIGFGTMNLGYPTFRQAARIPDPERFAMLDRAYELGCTFWDTSDFYGDGEDFIGKWLSKNPEKAKDIFLATKFGAMQLENSGFTFRGDAEYVPIACEKSLKRLGVDCIDLWYPHRLDGSTPVELIVGEMVKLKEQGKIRHLGLVEVSSETLRRAHAVHPIAAVQVEYSAFSTDIEDPAQGDLLATCRELGVAIVAYSPLSRGMLSGQLKSADDIEEDDARKQHPRFWPENFHKNLEIVAAIKAVAERKGCTVGQVALAWLLGQGDDIFPIPGTIRPKYLEENFGAIYVDLTPEEVKEIRSLVQKASVAGDRYPEHLALGLFADTPTLEEYRSQKNIKGKIADGRTGK